MISKRLPPVALVLRPATTARFRQRSRDRYCRLDPVLSVGGTGYQPVLGGNLPRSTRRAGSPPEQASGRFHPKPSFKIRSQPERCSCRTAAVPAAHGVSSPRGQFARQLLIHHSVSLFRCGKCASPPRLDGVSRRDGGGPTALVRLNARHFGTNSSS